MQQRCCNWMRSFSIFAAGIFFYSAVASPLAEANFWQERRKSAQAVNAQPSLEKVAQLPTSVSELNNALPRVTNTLPDMQGGVGDIPLGQARQIDGENAKRLPQWLNSLPTAYGDIQKVNLVVQSEKRPAGPAGSATGRQPLVVLIQDVHEIYSAQVNIANILAHLQTSLNKEQKTFMVGLEGAAGRFDLKRFRQTPNKEHQEIASDLLLQNNLLSGPEYFGFTAEREPLIWGVETPRLYIDNVNAYRDAHPKKAEFKNLIASLDASLKPVKDRFYALNVWALDENLSAYHRGDLDLLHYVRFLSSQLPSVDAFPEIKKLLDVLSMEESLDFKEVEAERTQLIKIFSQKLDQPSLQELLKYSMAYKVGQVSYGVYYDYLRSLSTKNGINLKKLSAFDKYIQYVLKAESIDKHKLFDQVDAIKEAVIDLLGSTREQRDILRISEDIKLLSRLMEQEFGPAEWKQYLTHHDSILNLSQRIDSFSQDGQKAGNQAKLNQSQLSSLLPLFEKFYMAADKRNDAMITNMLAGSREAGVDTIVLVAGGFHTPVLESMLKEKSISSIVVTPKVGAIDKGSKYLDVFAMNHVPLEKMLLGEKLYMSTPRLSGPNTIQMPFAHTQRDMEAVFNLIHQALGDAESADPKSEILQKGLPENAHLYRIRSPESGQYAYYYAAQGENIDALKGFLDRHNIQGVSIDKLNRHPDLLIVQVDPAYMPASTIGWINKILQTIANWLSRNFQVLIAFIEDKTEHLIITPGPFDINRYQAPTEELSTDEVQEMQRAFYQMLLNSETPLNDAVFQVGDRQFRFAWAESREKLKAVLGQLSDDAVRYDNSWETDGRKVYFTLVPVPIVNEAARATTEAIEWPESKIEMPKPENAYVKSMKKQEDSGRKLAQLGLAIGASIPTSVVRSLAQRAFNIFSSKVIHSEGAATRAPPKRLYWFLMAGAAGNFKRGKFVTTFFERAEGTKVLDAGMPLSLQEDEEGSVLPVFEIKLMQVLEDVYQGRAARGSVVKLVIAKSDEENIKMRLEVPCQQYENGQKTYNQLLKEAGVDLQYQYVTEASPVNLKDGTVNEKAKKLSTGHGYQFFWFIQQMLFNPNPEFDTESELNFVNGDSINSGIPSELSNFLDREKGAFSVMMTDRLIVDVKGGMLIFLPVRTSDGRIVLQLKALELAQAQEAGKMVEEAFQAAGLDKEKMAELFPGLEMGVEQWNTNSILASLSRLYEFVKELEKEIAGESIENVRNTLKGNKQEILDALTERIGWLGIDSAVIDGLAQRCSVGEETALREVAILFARSNILEAVMPDLIKNIRIDPNTKQKVIQYEGAAVSSLINFTNYVAIDPIAHRVWTRLHPDAPFLTIVNYSGEDRLRWFSPLKFVIDLVRELVTAMLDTEHGKDRWYLKHFFTFDTPEGISLNKNYDLMDWLKAFGYIVKKHYLRQDPKATTDASEMKSINCPSTSEVMYFPSTKLVGDVWFNNTSNSPVDVGAKKTNFHYHDGLTAQTITKVVAGEPIKYRLFENPFFYVDSGNAEPGVVHVFNSVPVPVLLQERLTAVTKQFPEMKKVWSDRQEREAKSTDPHIESHLPDVIKNWDSKEGTVRVSINNQQEPINAHVADNILQVFIHRDLVDVMQRDYKEKDILPSVIMYIFSQIMPEKTSTPEMRRMTAHTFGLTNDYEEQIFLDLERRSKEAPVDTLLRPKLLKSNMANKIKGEQASFWRNIFLGGQASFHERVHAWMARMFGHAVGATVDTPEKYGVEITFKNDRGVEAVYRSPAILNLITGVIFSVFTVVAFQFGATVFNHMGACSVINVAILFFYSAGIVLYGYLAVTGFIVGAAELMPGGELRELLPPIQRQVFNPADAAALIQNIASEGDRQRAESLAAGYALYYAADGTKAKDMQQAFATALAQQIGANPSTTAEGAAAVGNAASQAMDSAVNAGVHDLEQTELPVTIGNVPLNAVGLSQLEAKHPGSIREYIEKSARVFQAAESVVIITADGKEDQAILNELRRVTDKTAVFVKAQMSPNKTFLLGQTLADANIKPEKMQVGGYVTATELSVMDISDLVALGYADKDSLNFLAVLVNIELGKAFAIMRSVEGVQGVVNDLNGLVLALEAA